MLILTFFLNLFLLIHAELENGYGYQTGQISMKDSEIILLINSTFEIIEDFDNETEVLVPVTSSTAAPSASSTPETLPPSEKTPLKMKKLRPSTNVQCQKYTEAEKYKLLETAGGRNQFFMADSVDEAALNFADSFPESPFPNTLEDAVQENSGSQPSNCDSRCQMIKTALKKEISRRSTNSSTTSRRMFARFRATVLNDAPPMACSLGNFIPVGVCSELGEPVDGGTHEALCSACRGLYMLGSNCFPKIFNTVQCNSQEMGCIFDTITDMAHGQCDVQTLSFKVLRNAGDASCEEWIVEQIQLPVACQCSLSKNSFLRSKPTKEL